MQLRTILEALESEAPFSLQESYDNSGIQIGSPEQDVKRGLIALDVSPAVLQEAIHKECDLILSHHPLLFKGLKRITGASATEEVVMEAIRRGIAIVAVHTNLDNIRHGVNHELGRRLGLNNMRVLKPVSGLLRKLVTFCPLEHAVRVRAALFQAGAGHIGDYDCCSFNTTGKGSFRAGESASPFVGNIQELHYEPEERIETIFPEHSQNNVIAALMESHPYEEVAYDIYRLENPYDRVGSGMVGELEKALPKEEFLHLLKERLGAACLRYCEGAKDNVKQVAICGGSGSFLIQDALRAGADAFVTGDVKYHQFFDASGKLMIVDAGHYETEQYTRELILEILKKKNINFALLISEVSTNPVRCF